ncbi:MAG: ABC transporter ATP-binding protein [Phycisphaerae bacterium]|nr:ABC transporter ATP-binding protein [Phycisphaerae bacterium]
MPGQLAIDLEDVCKIYKGRIEALAGISMQVSKGEIFGLLGPNGAGKSTLVKIMMTVIHPTRARGTILGRPVGHKPTLARIGYLPEHHRFPLYLTGRQTVMYQAAMCGVSRTRRKRETDRLLDVVRMKSWENKKLSTYSKGMMQRIGLAASMVNDPDLVVLDEPTDGVDPVARREIRDVLSSMRADGRTVFLNSHLLSEVELVCDRVAILLQGRLSKEGTIDELTESSQRYEIIISGPAPDWIGEFEGEAISLEDPERTRMNFQGFNPEQVQPVIDRLRAESIQVISIKDVRETLEDLFMRLVTDEKTGATMGPGGRVAGRGGDAR